MTDAENPYTPPQAELLPEQGQVEYPTATGGKRFLNYLIDRVGIYGFTFAIGLGLGLIENFTQTDTTSFLSEGGIIGNVVFGFCASFLYYTILEGLTGASPGKWATGTRAVMLDGSPLTFKAAVLRSLCRLIPFEPFSFLGKNTGWHDTITDTKVIDRRAEPVVSRRDPHVRPRPLPPQVPWQSAGILPPPRRPMPTPPTPTSADEAQPPPAANS